MPENIKLIDKNGVVNELTFIHALNLLRLQQKQGIENVRIESSKFEFKKNEIVRIKSNKKDKKKAK